MRKLLLAGVSILVWTGVSTAQDLADGLVTVNIQDVLQDIAVDLNVEENTIPVNVQVPVSVAANVCDVDVGVLTAQLDSGSATCVAVTGSQEVTQIVQQEIDTGTDSASDDTSGDTSDDDVAQDGDGGTTGGTDDDDVAQDDGTGAVDDTQTSSTSARELAPGRSDNPPPGQTADPQANAPGQLKKECAEGEANCE